MELQAGDAAALFEQAAVVALAGVTGMVVVVRREGENEMDANQKQTKTKQKTNRDTFDT